MDLAKICNLCVVGCIVIVAVLFCWRFWPREQGLIIENCTFSDIDESEAISLEGPPGFEITGCLVIESNKPEDEVCIMLK